eukprot:767971-Hanusia_phi.AAC.3
MVYTLPPYVGSGGVPHCKDPITQNQARTRTMTRISEEEDQDQERTFTLGHLGQDALTGCLHPTQHSHPGGSKLRGRHQCLQHRTALTLRCRR